MTLEEARQISKGDRIVVETTIGDNDIVNDDGYILLVRRYIPPSDIRKKLEPTTRRKFKALDIVFAQGAYWIVGQNERDDGSVLVGMMGAISRYKHKDLELICAAENREYRKGEA